MVSYLPGKDVRGCLWTCRALREAAISNREAMDRETELAFQLRPRKVSSKFETDFREWREAFYETQSQPNSGSYIVAFYLTQRAEDTADGEVDNVMEKIHLEVPTKIFCISPELKFGSDWEDRILRIVGFNDQPWLRMYHGDLVIVEKRHNSSNPAEDGSNMTTEGWLIRLDDEKEDGGKIIDKWDYLDLVDTEDDRLRKKDYCKSYLEGSSCRRGNRVLCAFWKTLDYRTESHKKAQLEHPDPSDTFWYLFLVMVDLEEDKVLWKKKAGYDYDWDTRKLYFTDKICGFFRYQHDCDPDPKILRRFDVETGTELRESVELFFAVQEMELASGNDLLALITEPKHYNCHDVQFNLVCQTLDVVDTGSTLSYKCLTVPADAPNNSEIGVLPDLDESLGTCFALFGDRVLVMCDTHVGGDRVRNRTARVCFAFWDLEETKSRSVKIGVCYSENFDENDQVVFNYKDVEADLVMARLVWLDGFENIGPSLTGNIWLLLSSEVRKGKDNHRQVWQTVHAVDLNRSVGALWNLSRRHNSID